MKEFQNAFSNDDSNSTYKYFQPTSENILNYMSYIENKGGNLKNISDPIHFFSTKLL